MSEGPAIEPVRGRPDREWEGLRQLVDEVGEGLARYRDCDGAEEVLAGVSGVHAALNRLENTVQSAHLACCVLPCLEAPDELALALARLSGAGIGALVVIEQQRNLDEYIARGTRLDAELSASLLESLFYPGSTLHDGAVIVRGTRIMAAGVFVPLAAERRDPAHGRPLGARHRAALGLSRLTDALVFVVSEQTGDVSVALRGMLHQGVHIEAVLRRRGAEAERHPTRPTPKAEGSWLGRLRRQLRSFARRPAGSPERS